MFKNLITIIVVSLIIGCSNDSNNELVEIDKDIVTFESAEPVEEPEQVDHIDDENISESNQYAEDNPQGNSWNGYECTSDCSGHEAGYDWALDNNVTDESSCDGKSNSFNEGCEQYISENAANEDEVEDVEE